jgi:hypothetical protein
MGQHNETNIGVKVPAIAADGDLSDERCRLLLTARELEPEKFERKIFGVPSTPEHKAAFAKVVCAMANSEGGYVLLGVSDDGSIAGVDAAEADNARFNDIVSKFAYPEIRSLICRVYSHDGQDVIVVFVPASDLLPHVTTKDGGNGILNRHSIYVRHSGQSLPAGPKDMERIISKACRLKQKDFLKFIEETQLQSDIRAIKEHLLGDEAVKGNYDSIAFGSDAEFMREIEAAALHQRGDQIKIVSKLLSRHVQKHWESTRGCDEHEVRSIRDQHVLPMLDKLMYLCVLWIRDGDSIEPLRTCLKAWCSVYELAAMRDLGCPTSGDVVPLSPNGQYSKAKDHLTFTLPSKECYKRLLACCAYAAHVGNLGSLVTISWEEVDWRKADRRNLLPLMRHPAFEYRSGEGTPISVFDEASELMQQDQTLRTLFGAEADAIRDSLLFADMLVSFVLFRDSTFKGGKDRVPNFARFYSHRVMPHLRRMREEPRYFLGRGFPTYTDDEIKNFVLHIMTFAKNNFFSYGTDWDQVDYEELFGERPPSN